MWEWPACARFFERLAHRCRLVVYDKQGTGLSDRVATFPTLEARMDDIDAVMTANEMDRALFGPTQGAALSALFAATYPERVDALVTYGAFARVADAPDWPYGAEEDAGGWGERMLEGWGTPSWTRDFAVDWGRRISAMTPRSRGSRSCCGSLPRRRRLWRSAVRGTRPTFETSCPPSAPTLLMYRGTDDPERAEIEHTAHLLPITRVVELPPDHWSPYIADPGPMVEAIESFLEGVGNSAASPRSGAGDGLLHRHRRLHAAGLRAGGPRLARARRTTSPGDPCPAGALPRR